MKALNVLAKLLHLNDLKQDLKRVKVKQNFRMDN